MTENLDANAVWFLSCGHWCPSEEWRVRNEAPGVSFDAVCDECTTDQPVIGWGWIMRKETDASSGT